MNGAFYIGAIGLSAQQKALEITANNIANLNTVGFKRSAVRFSELVGAQRTELETASAPPDRASTLSGVMVGATPHIWSQGDLKQTGQPLDLAIDGEGFIELLGPSGQSLLWRGGTLKISEDGTLATGDGLPLRSMISVPIGATALAISRDGKVSAQMDGAESRVLGQIDMVMAKDADALLDAGNGTYQSGETELYPVQPGEEGGSFVQGALESANVQLAEEMTTLLLTQRAFAANAQVVQAGDQLMSIINTLRR